MQDFHRKSRISLVITLIIQPTKAMCFCLTLHLPNNSDAQNYQSKREKLARHYSTCLQFHIYYILYNKITITIMSKLHISWEYLNNFCLFTVTLRAEAGRRLLQNSTILSLLWVQPVLWLYQDTSAKVMVWPYLQCISVRNSEFSSK